MSENWYNNGDEYGNEYNEAYVNLDRRKPYVTYTLLGINIIAFILMNLVGYVYHLNQMEELILFGAKVNILISYGQYWRLLTAMFLHIGILHLFFNSYALYIYSPIVEGFYGKLKFIVVYLVSGLTGSLFSYMFSQNVSAGASGAIFGLMGSLLYFRQRHKLAFKRIFGPRLFIVIGFNLLYGFISSGIDNWGHIGGLIGGYLVGNAVGLYKEPVIQLKKIIAWVLIFLIFFFGLQYGQDKYRIETIPQQPKLPEGNDTLKADSISEIDIAYEYSLSSLII